MKEIYKYNQNWKEDTMQYYRTVADRLPENKAQRWGTPSWDRPGLEKIVEEAKRYFEEKTGVNLPYNFAIHGPYVYHSRQEKHYNDLHIIEGAARLSGWLRAAVEIPFLVHLIKKTQSCRGINSPYTTLNLHLFVARFSSPHRAARFASKVKRRANQILSSYGLRCSWRALAETLTEGRKKVGKAAFMAAAKTVKQYAGGCRNRPGIPMDFEWDAYREGRLSGQEYLALVHGWRDALKAPEGICAWALEKVQDRQFPNIKSALLEAEKVLICDRTDGIECYIDPSTKRIIHEVETVLAYYKRSYALILVTSKNGRSYHHHDYSIGWNDVNNNRKYAIRVALKAWKEQKRMEQKLRPTIDALCPEDRTILVWREDSYKAGNCKPGTEEFAKMHGWKDRAFIPASWLLPHISNPAVQRVLKSLV